MKKLNIIETKQKELEVLSRQSLTAIDMVNSTIQNLTAINSNIESKLQEINEHKASLSAIETELEKNKTHNSKIITKFKALIED